MIYEVRTYNIKPKAQAEVEKRFGEAYEYRKKLSPLAAFWHTEIGPLNQIIHVWPYKDLAERDKIRAAAVQTGNWPPNTGDLLLDMRSEIYIPFSISPEIKPGKMGPYFEMRTYTVLSGDLPKIQKIWEQAIPARIKISPLVGVWYSELGGLNRFTHIWAYTSLNHRNEARDQALAAGVWPPSIVAKKLNLPDGTLIAQENKIVMPSAFSPLQ